MPFVVTLSTGQRVRVTGPETIMLGRRWDTAAFVNEQGSDRIVVIWHTRINSVGACDPVRPPPSID